MRYKKYLFVFFLVIVVQSATVFALNWTIDPYKVSDVVSIHQFNQAKPEVVKQARLFKAIATIYKRPEIVLLGSSRTDLGLDPSYFREREDRAYNLGILGANMYEVLRYFQHAIANQPNLEQAIVGLDFFMFNQNRTPQMDFREERLGKTRVILTDWFNTTFSLNAIAASFATVESNRKNPNFDPYEENGLRNNRNFIKSNVPQSSIVKGFEASLKKFLNDPTLYNNYQLSKEAFQSLKILIELCQQNDIDLKLFISPAHAVQWEAIRAAGLWEVFEQWKRGIAEIAPVWDFSGYNSITTEPVSDEMQNYLDSSHYAQNIGDLILNRILHNRIEQTPSNFGTLLTPEKVSVHLDEIRRDREAWVQTQPDVLNLIKVQSVRPSLSHSSYFSLSRKP
ncbi:MAG: hypothetical protein SVX43_12805 [Cyanobacteriota bacterium]|nr:hypothetical protein [Cyanobacteriota bacterium]